MKHQTPSQGTTRIATVCTHLLSTVAMQLDPVTRLGYLVQLATGVLACSLSAGHQPEDVATRAARILDALTAGVNAATDSAMEPEPEPAPPPPRDALIDVLVGHNLEMMRQHGQLTTETIRVLTNTIRDLRAQNEALSAEVAAKHHQLEERRAENDVLRMRRDELIAENDARRARGG